MPTLTLSPIIQGALGWLPTGGNLYVNEGGPNTASELEFVVLPATLPAGAIVLGVRLTLFAGRVISATDPVAFPETVTIRARLGALGTSFRSTNVAGIVAQRVLGGTEDPWGINAAFLTTAWRIYVSRGVGPNEDLVRPRYVGAFATLQIDYEIGTTPPNTPMGELRSSATQQTLLGRQTARGAPVANPNFRATSIRIRPTQEASRSKKKKNGKFAYGTRITKEHSVPDIEVDPTFDEMGWIVQACLGRFTSGTVPGATTAFRHSVAIGQYADIDRAYLTVVHGNKEDGRERVSDLSFSELTLTINDEEMTADVGGFSSKIDKTTPFPTGATEVQRVSVTATSGTFAIERGHHATSDLNVAGLTSAMLQTALNALPSIGASGVAVSGVLPDLNITWNGTAFAGEDQPLLRVVRKQVTGGDVVVTQPTKGGFREIVPTPIEPGDRLMGLYISPTFAGLEDAANRVTDVKDVALGFGALGTPRFAMDDAGDTFRGAVDGSDPAITLMHTAEKESAFAAAMDRSRGNGRVFVRWFVQSADGVTIDGSVRYRIEFTGMMDIDSKIELKDGEEVYAYDYTLVSIYDPTIGVRPVLSLVNGIADYV